MERRDEGRGVDRPLTLLRLGIHPASRAWLIRERNLSDDRVCSGCVSYLRAGARAFCTDPGNLSGPVPTFPSWPACVLWRDDGLVSSNEVV